ncbi:MAG: hypothetical protein ACREIN_03075 [Candidatus Methylomirabilaceae bacterium]
MDVLKRYKEHITRIDQFVRGLDPAVRGEAFRFLMEKCLITDKEHVSPKSVARSAEGLVEEAEVVFQRLSEDSGIAPDRLMEVYGYRDSTVQVIDSSIPNQGPADLLRKITLLCTYGNIVGRKIAKVEMSVIYENLRNLRAETTSYSRDVKKTDGVKVVTGGAMLPPDGREKAQTMLRQVLRIST